MKVEQPFRAIDFEREQSCRRYATTRHNGMNYHSQPFVTKPAQSWQITKLFTTQM